MHCCIETNGVLDNDTIWAVQPSTIQYLTGNQFLLQTEYSLQLFWKGLYNIALLSMCTDPPNTLLKEQFIIRPTILFPSFSQHHGLFISSQHHLHYHHHHHQPVYTNHASSAPSSESPTAIRSRRSKPTSVAPGNCWKPADAARRSSRS